MDQWTNIWNLSYLKECFFLAVSHFLDILPCLIRNMSSTAFLLVKDSDNYFFFLFELSREERATHSRSSLLQEHTLAQAKIFRQKFFVCFLEKEIFNWKKLRKRVRKSAGQWICFRINFLQFCNCTFLPTVGANNKVPKKVSFWEIMSFVPCTFTRIYFQPEKIFFWFFLSNQAHI